MNDPLMLPVVYEGEELEFPLSMIPGAYAPRFAVLVNGIEVIYERDDEGAFRAIIQHPELATGKLPARSLLEAISTVLQEATG